MGSGLLGIGKLPGELLAELLGAHPVFDPSVVVGPGVGRDAAAIAAPESGLLVLKTDPITFARERAPHYLVNVNANDLACLGATPRWMLVTALFPAGETTGEMVRTLFDELNAACAARGIALVGGHTEITDAVNRPILVGQLIGTAQSNRLLTPGGAKPGDRILLTRPIAIEGSALLALEMGDRLAELVGAGLVGRAARFLDDPGISVQDDAAALLQTGVVTALHDPTEGGLATGIRELAASAGNGAVISRTSVPVMPETAAFAAALGLDPLGMLASGSLLATVPAAGMAIVETACKEAGMPFAWLGKILPAESGLTLRTGGDEQSLPVFDTDEVARALSAPGGGRA